MKTLNLLSFPTSSVKSIPTLQLTSFVTLKQSFNVSKAPLAPSEGKGTVGQMVPAPADESCVGPFMADCVLMLSSFVLHRAEKSSAVTEIRSSSHKRRKRRHKCRRRHKRALGSLSSLHIKLHMFNAPVYVSGIHRLTNSGKLVKQTQTSITTDVATSNGTIHQEQPQGQGVQVPDREPGTILQPGTTK